MISTILNSAPASDDTPPRYWIGEIASTFSLGSDFNLFFLKGIMSYDPALVLLTLKFPYYYAEELYKYEE